MGGQGKGRLVCMSPKNWSEIKTRQRESLLTDWTAIKGINKQHNTVSSDATEDIK